MKNGATRELFAYWDDLRGSRAAPERSDIDPTAIRAILADTFVLDVGATFPLRLAGTRVNALFDRDLAGRSFLDLWQPEERRNVAAMLSAVVDGASPVVAGATGAPRGERESALEWLFLPLRHFGRTHARILGIVTPAVRPGWIGLRPPEPLALRSLRVVDPREEGRHRPAEVGPGRLRLGGIFALDGGEGRDGPPAGVERLIAARPALRLIEGGRDL